ncbi:MAG: L-seryl-tRNA(Sec) selenium transferase, partial [Syntrophomonadaceae bacterium]|nr:L-seryl-tRNA(Sec) selenium transferase [Syntrophomonadaceae bacterium]
IIVGKRSLIEKMKKNHLLRALRVDKMTIAALESTLRCYIDGNPHQTVPVLEMLTYSTSDLEDKANQLGTLIQDVLRDWEGEYSIRVVETQDKVGGGAYPLQVLPGFGVEIQFDFDPEVLARQLRLQEPAI